MPFKSKLKTTRSNLKIIDEKQPLEFIEKEKQSIDGIITYEKMRLFLHSLFY